MLKIDTNLVQVIVNYLATRPYGDVFQLIERISKLESVEEVKPEETEK